MSIMQTLLALAGLIEPTIPVGGKVFTDGVDTSTYPGNGTPYLVADNSYTIPANWITKDYRYEWEIYSEASYTCIGCQLSLYKNGVLVYSYTQPASSSSYWRSNTGALSANHTLSLAAGDTVQAQIYITGRNAGGSTPTTTNYHELERIT